MALKAVVQSLEDVPEAFRSLYVEGQGGTFRLDAEGVEDVSGLKSALQAEREERKRAERRLKGLDGIDPDEYAALKKAAEEAEKKKAADEGNWKSLEQQLNERHLKEVTKHTERQKLLTAALEEELVDAAASRALAKHGGSVDLLLPHVAARMAVVEENGKFVAVVVDENGNPRVGEKSNRMSVDELVQEMKANQDFGRAFEGSGASGSGASKTEKAGGGTPGVIALGDEQAFLANLDKIAKGEVAVQ